MELNSDMEPDDTSDSLAGELAQAADQLAVGDPDVMLATVHRVATRRRHRRNAFAGIAAAATLLVSGVVVAQFLGGSSGDDRIASAPATEPTDTEPTDTDPVDTEPPATDPVSTNAALVPVAGENSDAESDAVTAVPDGSGASQVIPSALTDGSDPGLSSSDAMGQNQIFPWKGGVLSIRTAQPLPTKLPTEVVDAFPPEVQELFPDGLPATIEEATALLQEAGLLDEVAQIISDNAEVSDAIYSQSREAQLRTVRFSADGVEWSDIDAAFPAGADDWSEAVSSGDRFAYARNVVSTDASPGDATDDRLPPDIVAIEIHSSTNLVDWTVQTIPAPQRPAGIDPSLPFQVFGHGLSVTDSAFAISVDAMVQFDPVELLDPELRDRVYSGGSSVTQGDEGVTIEIYDTSDAGGDGDPDRVVETLTFTWADLGLTGPPPENAGSGTYRYVGTWDGAEPVITESEGAWSDVRAVGDTFVELSPTEQWSTDGVEWTPFEVPGAGRIEAIVATGEGVAIRSADQSGASTTYVGDLVRGEWTPVATPGLPDQVYVETLGAGAFLLASTGDENYVDPYADAIGARSSAEVDGFRYESESTWGDRSGEEYVVTYRLTDIASGEVVVTETSEGVNEVEPFEYLDYESGFGDGFGIVDPETGEALVTIPHSALVEEIINADGSTTDPSTFEDTEISEPYFPAYWLLASLEDGWIVQELGIDENGGYPTSVVALDDAALVALSDGRILRATAT